MLPDNGVRFDISRYAEISSALLSPNLIPVGEARELPPEEGMRQWHLAKALQCPFLNDSWQATVPADL